MALETLPVDEVLLEPARAERFWARAIPEPNTGCWIWTGALDRHGYGKHAYENRGRRYAGAHRVAWRLARGEIPVGLVVCHHCDQRHCVNPDHLFVGTQMQNMQDASRKGRLGTRPTARPQRPPLGHGDVALVRRLYGDRAPAILGFLGS